VGKKMSELIVNKDDEKIDVCVLENNLIVEIYSYKQGEESILGNIYRGEVKDVVDGMQAAFVDIGLEKNAFIPIKDAIPKTDVTKESQSIAFKISDVLHVGQKILVQVRKVPTSLKGARVSTHITIPGNYIVLMPNTDIITISQKVEGNEEKDRLVEMLKRNIPEGYGAIVRTDAVGINEGEIKKDINELVEKWKNICCKYEEDEKQELLYNEHELVSKISRDLITRETKKIYVNDKELYQQIKQVGLKSEESIQFVDSKNIIQDQGFMSSYESAFKRKIWLKCGGYIVIDKTEALTAIDVNSGKYVGNKNLEQTALIVNKEAAAEIMHQIRLRDVGGIIVVDYIDLLNKENQSQIIKIMQNEAKKDRSKIDIKGYTELNLVELTRKTINI
jgi:ribonuclease G